MTLYSLILFTHVTAVLALFACLSLETVSLYHLRRAFSLTEVQLWISPVPGLTAVSIGSLLVILVSGIYLTVRMSGFGLAWIDVAMGAFLLMAPLGALTGRRTRYLRRLIAGGRTNQLELLNLPRRPFLAISLCIRIAVFLGIVLLMTAKPDLPESLVIVGACVVLGLSAAFFIPTKARPLSAISNLRG